MFEKESAPKLKRCSFPGCEAIIPVAWYGWIELNPIVPAEIGEEELENLKSAVKWHKSELCWEHFAQAERVLSAWREGALDEVK